VLEAAQPVRIVRTVEGQDLDRDIAGQALVAGPVDLAHPAGTEGSEDLVGAEVRARRNQRPPSVCVEAGGRTRKVMLLDSGSQANAGAASPSMFAGRLTQPSSPRIHETVRGGEARASSAYCRPAVSPELLNTRDLS
jgi:hypothetical protein